MGKMLIVGAGQAGLQLALGLIEEGHEVTVVSNRTPQDIHDGRVMSSQCMFHAALQTERDLGLDFWESECPPVEGISLAVPAPDGTGKAIDWASRLDNYAESVDQRVKMPGWLEQLERHSRTRTAGTCLRIFRSAHTCWKPSSRVLRPTLKKASCFRWTAT